ncbi:MAG: HEPN domain-containing protein [Candidatus Binatia bacterium]
MDLERAHESLKAAQLCLQEGLVNPAASRAYYAMFQAAQIALEAVSILPEREWSHQRLQGVFVSELIHRCKIYPSVFRDYLSSGLIIRQSADYGQASVSRKIAQRLVHRAALFVTAVEEKTHYGS